MPTISLTQLAVDRIKPPKGQPREEHFDKNQPGFALRVTDKGHKSWIVMYRLKGRTKIERYTIGSLDDFPKVEKARDIAREIRQKAAKGEDPKAERRAAPKREPDTVRSTALAFIELHAKVKNRSWRDAEGIFNKHVLPRWGEREMRAITRRDVIELLDAVAKPVVAKKGERPVGGPIAANRTLAHVRKLFNWAVARDIIDASPVTAVEAPGKETRRDRHLSDDEIKTLWAELDGLDYPIAPYFKLLLATGQRREEVAGMRWGQINEKEKLWTIPSYSTKADRTHIVPLSELAIEILGKVPRVGEHVFTTRRDRPVSGYSKMKAAVDGKVAESAKMEPWTIHDLRRTVATGMGRLKITRFLIGRVLNHADPGVTAVYDRYEYLDEKRHALDAWASHLDRILNPPGDNVVPLAPRAAG
jgi:integrase